LLLLWFYAVFFWLFDRQNHEDEGIPQHVGDEHGHKSPCDPVKAPPEKAAGEGGKDEHGIACGQMDRRVKARGEDKGKPASPSFFEAALHKTPPENFLSEPYGEKQKQRHKAGRESSEVRVNGSGVPCAVREEEWKKPGDQDEKLVSHVEKSIQKSGQKDSKKNIPGSELASGKERADLEKGDG